MFDEFLEVSLVDSQDFDVNHSEIIADGTKVRRTMHLKDLMGDASRWVRAIEDCRASAVKVEHLYTRSIPKFFEMQGVLLKKHKTSKCWDKRFFVLSVSRCRVCWARRTRVAAHARNNATACVCVYATVVLNACGAARAARAGAAILQNVSLVYFSKPSDQSGRGKYDLRHNTRIVVCPPSLRPLAFTLETVDDTEPGPTMAAEDAKEFEAWMAAINQVITNLRQQRAQGILSAAAGAGSGGATAAAPRPAAGKPPGAH